MNNKEVTGINKACKQCQRNGRDVNIHFLFVSPGAQSDSELSSHHPSEVSVDRGYTSDSEVYTEHSKTRIPRSLTDMDAASSGWLLVSTSKH